MGLPEMLKLDTNQKNSRPPHFASGKGYFGRASCFHVDFDKELQILGEADFRGVEVLRCCTRFLPFPHFRFEIDKHSNPMKLIGFLSTFQVSYNYTQKRA